MFLALALIAPWTLAVALLASGIGKLRHPDSLSGWAQLGVARPLRRRWLLRFHPWGEIALGVALLSFGRELGVAFGVAATLLMVGYTVLIWRSYRQEDEASCACFGQDAPVTGVTVARNLWLVALAIGAAVAQMWLPLWGGAARAGFDGRIGVLVAAAVTAATAVLTLYLQQATDVPDAGLAGVQVDDVGDYVRVRTPAVPVTLADGTVATLRTLTERRPLLLLAVSETCHACEEIVAAAPGYRLRLPEVDVRLLLTHAPADDSLTEHAEPQSLHDPHGYVPGSIANWPTPTAVLFGADGLVAGGPVSGTRSVGEFVDIIDEDLHGVSAVG